VLRTQQLSLTPQESEQLSKYVSDDTYVKQQKEDIEELATMFKDMMGQTAQDAETGFLKALENHFVPADGFSANYLFQIEGTKKPLYVSIQQGQLQLHSGQEEEEPEADVVAKLTTDVMQSIVDGRMTFQRAFMTGDMTAKGNFKTLRMLDQVFAF
jgi:putative sterol carrier protein